MSEIAVFGGTFDPPTLAHEAIIRSTLAREDMDEVWIMPSGKRLDKFGMLDDCVRLEMLDEMHTESFGLDERLVVTDFEMRLTRPTQTIDTVEVLKRDCPEDRFWFIFGADSFNGMHTWNGGRELQEELSMLIVPRLGEDMPAEGDNIKHLAVPGVLDYPVSSTLAREAIRNRQPVGRFVSKAIARYLEINHCYNR